MNVYNFAYVARRWYMYLPPSVAPIKWMQVIAPGLASAKKLFALIYPKASLVGVTENFGDFVQIMESP